MNRIHLAAYAACFALLASGCERAGTPEPFPQDAADGWLEASGGRWRLTERGLALTDSIAAGFLEVEAP